MRETEWEEDALEDGLTRLREALAAMNKVPAWALSADQHDQFQQTVRNLRSLERALTNELHQQRESQEEDDA